MFTVKQLKVSVDSRVLMPSLSAHWHRGMLVAVLGPNGVGKSTVLSHVCGASLYVPDCVYLDDFDVFKMTPLQRAQRIASIAQYDEADPETLVQDRIAHGLYARQRASHLSSGTSRLLVRTIAESLGISEFLGRPLYSLSGGQRKKVHIARALVDDAAEVYILDEPDASLDAESKARLMGLLKSISRRNKIVVTSLHHLDLAESFCDQRLDLALQ